MRIADDAHDPEPRRPAERKNDGSGRRFTVAVVDEQQAPIIQRIFTEYLANRGLKAIAHQLNHECIPSPSSV